MSDRSKNAGRGDYEVGYGKPPQRARFRKGRSGNPGGRPRGVTAGRAKALALKKAYRMVRVKVGDSTVSLPAIQVILHGQVALAAKGNGPAQRAVIEKVQAIEQELALEAAAEAAETKATERCATESSPGASPGSYPTECRNGARTPVRVAMRAVLTMVRM